VNNGSTPRLNLNHSNARLRHWSGMMPAGRARRQRGSRAYVFSAYPIRTPRGQKLKRSLTQLPRVTLQATRFLSEARSTNQTSRSFRRNAPLPSLCMKQRLLPHTSIQADQSSKCRRCLASTRQDGPRVGSIISAQSQIKFNRTCVETISFDLLKNECHKYNLSQFVCCQC
jgi:hypothetical protein